MKLDIDSRLFLKRKFSQKFDLISFETQFIGMFCEFKEEFNLNVYSKNKKRSSHHTPKLNEPNILQTNINPVSGWRKKCILLFFFFSFLLSIFTSLFLTLFLSTIICKCPPPSVTDLPLLEFLIYPPHHVI